MAMKFDWFHGSASGKAVRIGGETRLQCVSTKVSHRIGIETHSSIRVAVC